MKNGGGGGGVGATPKEMARAKNMIVNNQEERARKRGRTAEKMKHSVILDVGGDRFLALRSTLLRWGLRMRNLLQASPVPQAPDHQAGPADDGHHRGEDPAAVRRVSARRPAGVLLWPEPRQLPDDPEHVPHRQVPHDRGRLRPRLPEGPRVLERGRVQPRGVLCSQVLSRGTQMITLFKHTLLHDLGFPN